MAKRKVRSEPGAPAKQVASDWVEENGYRVAAAAAVPIPIPGAHTALCTALEAYMISNIAKIYGRSLSAGEAIALIPALGGAVLVGKTASSIAGELFGWIPVAGWLAKGAIGGATAYGIGKAAVSYFDHEHPGQEAAPFQTASLKAFVEEAFAALGFSGGEAKVAAKKAEAARQAERE